MPRRHEVASCRSDHTNTRRLVNDRRVPHRRRCRVRARERLGLRYRVGVLISRMTELRIQTAWCRNADGGHAVRLQLAISAQKIQIWVASSMIDVDPVSAQIEGLFVSRAFPGFLRSWCRTGP